MVQIRCTKKMIDELNLPLSGIAEIRSDGSFLGAWYANAVRFGRHKAVVVVNERTLFSFVVPGGFKNDPAAFTKAFLDGLARVLRSAQVSLSGIETLLAEHRTMEFTVTESRKVLGNMNDLVSMYDYEIEAAGGLTSEDLAFIIFKVNETPQRNIFWGNSHEALNRLLSDARLIDRKPPAGVLRDERIMQGLYKIGSKRTLHEIYGLFYGCAAAPGMVMPSQYLPLVYDPDDAVFDSEDHARKLLEALQELWLTIAAWRPGIKLFYYPVRNYAPGRAGVLQRGRDLSSFVEYFFKGLDLWKTREDDIAGDALDAMKALAQISAYLEVMAPIIERSKDEQGKEVTEAESVISRIEPVAADCIVRIHTQLRLVHAAGVAAGFEPVQSVERAGHVRIGRNEPCPCGSGKKYKRCCGLTH